MFTKAKDVTMKATKGLSLFAAFAASSFLTCSAFASASFSDAQIIGYIVASDDGQIEMSKIVQAKTQNSSVRDFAARMIKVHDDRTAELLAIAKEAGIEPSSSNDSSKLRLVLKDDVKELTAGSGAALDTRFLNQEIDHHRNVIQELTNVFLPAVENAKLATVLSGMRSRVPSNLAAAQRILGTLK